MVATFIWIGLVVAVLTGRGGGDTLNTTIEGAGAF